MTDTTKLLAATQLLNILYRDVQELAFTINYDEVRLTRLGELSADMQIKIDNLARKIRDNLFLMQNDVKELCAELLRK